MKRSEEAKKYLASNEVDKALEILEDPHDDELFLVISSYLFKGELQKAISFYEKHRQELWSYNPRLTIKTSLELFTYDENFKKARQELAILEDFPYVSQIVEETFKEAKETLERKEEAVLKSLKEKAMSLEECYRNASSINEKFKVLSVLSSSEIKEANSFLRTIYLDEKEEKEIRKFILLLLKEAGDQKPLLIDFGEIKRELSPSALKVPLQNAYDKEVIRQLSASIDDISRTRNATKLYENLTFAVFPGTIEEEGFKTEEAAEACLYWSFYSLGEDKSSDFSLFEREAGKEKIEKYQKFLRLFLPFLDFPLPF